jgi:hypothetical protein
MKREGKLVRLRLPDEVSPCSEERLNGGGAPIANGALREKDRISTPRWVTFDIKDVLYREGEVVQWARWRRWKRTGLVVEKGVDGGNRP